jgi:hypothetical protein
VLLTLSQNITQYVLLIDPKKKFPEIPQKFKNDGIHSSGIERNQKFIPNHGQVLYLRILRKITPKKLKI